MSGRSAFGDSFVRLAAMNRRHAERLQMDFVRRNNLLYRALATTERKEEMQQWRLAPVKSLARGLYGGLSISQEEIRSRPRSVSAEASQGRRGGNAEAPIQ
jgi:hypothetical protein